LYLRDYVNAGDLLIGNNLLINCYLLLEKKQRLDEASFLDFCSLINALTFHDKIITFGAELKPEISNSSVYRYLKENKILEEVAMKYVSYQDRLDIVDLFGGIVSEKYVDSVILHANDTHLDEGAYPSYEFRLFSGYRRFDSPMDIELERSMLIDEILKGNNHNEITSKIYSPFEFGGLVDRIYHIPVVGELVNTKQVRQKELFLVRTSLYWLIAGKLNISFMPDFMRIPLITAYGLRVRQSIALLIQSKFDEIVRNELEAASAVAMPVIIPIPNTMSKFLTKYPSLGFEDSINSLREEFAEHKKNIINWEKRLHMAQEKGYQEVLKVKKELSLSLESIKEEDKTDLALSFTPGIATDILGGTTGTSTATTAIEKAINIFRRWRRRRSINYFINGKKEASMVPKQNELLKEAFGNSLSPRQVDRFMSLADRLQKLYGTS